MSVAEQMTKADAFLQDAHLCAQYERYNSSVSRAYYAMFRAALALMEQYGYVRPAWNHGRLKGALVRNMVEGRAILTHREVEQLESVYTLRIQADYENQPVSAQDAREILNMVSSFIAKTRGAIDHET